MHTYMFVCVLVCAIIVTKFLNSQPPGLRHLLPHQHVFIFNHRQV